MAPFDPRLGFFAAQRRYAPDVEDHRPLGTSRALTGLETLTGYTANAARVDGGDGGVLHVLAQRTVTVLDPWRVDIGDLRLGNPAEDQGQGGNDCTDASVHGRTHGVPIYG